MNNPKNIIIHHSATRITDNNNQFEAINKSHIQRGYGYIGYHYLIESDGTIKKGREEKQIGAHCYQENMNYNSIGICLAGNFNIDDPTDKQFISLKSLLKTLLKKYNISKENIVGHRHYSNTYCPGLNFPDSLILNIMEEKKISEWATEAVIWSKKTKIATNWDNPQSPVTKEELSTMLFRFYELCEYQFKKNIDAE